MATFHIDGRTFSGSNVTIRNGNVIIDGKVQDGTVNGVVEVRVTEGVIQNLECDSSVVCGEVRGNVSAGGSVSCRNVSGSISAGGSVSAAGKPGGAINAGGSVRVG